VSDLWVRCHHCGREFAPGITIDSQDKGTWTNSSFGCPYCGRRAVYNQDAFSWRTGEELINLGTESTTQRDVYQNQIIYLPDLARSGRITAIFEDCEVRGPAIVFMTGETRFEDVTFVVKDGTDTICWEVPPGVTRIGAINLHDCLFKGGSVAGIGFAATRDFLESFKSGIAVS
jgi:hypothetical protein